MKNATEVKYEPTKKTLKKNEILQEYEDLKKKYIILVEKYKTLNEKNRKYREANKLLHK